jgi:hypothetical protein
VKWFVSDLVEVSKGKSVHKPKGELCMECGCIMETFPSDEFNDIKTQYQNNPAFHQIFEKCRSILRGELPRSWRPAQVMEQSKIGMSCSTSVYCVEESLFDKFYKLDSKKCLQEAPGSSMKPVQLKNPEGKEVSVYVLKSVDSLPPAIPFFKLKFFCDAATLHDDVFVDRNETLHEKHALLTAGFLVKCGLEERVVRMAGLPALLSFSDCLAQVNKGQFAIQEKEKERQRQAALAETGQAPAAGVVETSGSRLRRTLVAPSSLLDVVAPPPSMIPTKGRRGGSAGRGRGGGGGASGRGASSRLTSGASVTAGDEASASSRPSAVSVAEEGAPHDENMSDELAQLLTSTRGKPFPSMDAIFAGMPFKRELNGAVGSAHAHKQWDNG